MKNINTAQYWNKVYEREGYDDPCMRNDVYTFIAILSKVGDYVVPQKVLDVGCGNGYFLKYVSLTRDWELFGVDQSEKAIEVARSRVPEAQLFTADVEKLPFRDNGFDIVFCMETLEHLSRPERAINEMKRVVRPGGKIVVQVPYKDDIPSSEHVRQFDSESIVDLMGIDTVVAVIKHTGRILELPDDIKKPVHIIVAVWEK